MNRDMETVILAVLLSTFATCVILQIMPQPKTCTCQEQYETGPKRSVSSSYKTGNGG